jgi:Uma2 family endonuclease
MSIKARATVDDLARAPGKAELVNGEVVLMSPTGHLPAAAGGRIYISLVAHVDSTGVGWALPDNAAYLVNLPQRQSFSPDASFYVGPSPGMDFVPQPPAFAAEVRSKGDYGPRAEREMAQKRADYFAAGTQVVWDVDLLDEAVVRKYLPDSPTTPAAVFRRGEVADAEPAVPGWRMPVDQLFR